MTVADRTEGHQARCLPHLLMLGPQLAGSAGTEPLAPRLCSFAALLDRGHSVLPSSRLVGFISRAFMRAIPQAADSDDKTIS